MKASITLGRLFGVDIGLHYSWFIIALLITLSLVGHFGATDPNWSRRRRRSSPSYSSSSRSFSTNCLTLFALGGVATIENPSPDAKTEFWVAAAGPIASVAIGWDVTRWRRHLAGRHKPTSAHRQRSWAG